MKLDPTSRYDDGLADLLRGAEMAGRGKLGMAKFMVAEFSKKTQVMVDFDWTQPKLAAEKMMDKFFEILNDRIAYGKTREENGGA